MRTLVLLLVMPLAACGFAKSDGGGGGGGNATFPLHVSENGRFLEDANANSFLVTGDAAWTLMVALDEGAAETYLENRRQRGFNTVLVNAIERGFGGPQNADGDAPFEADDDWSHPVEAYWQHVDHVIDLAARKNMLVLLAPAYLGEDCGPQGWCQQMLDQSEAAMTAYGRFLGDRYADRNNIIWVHGGNTRAGDHGADSRLSAIANGILERAPAHLQTAHCSLNDSAIECYDEPWLDVNSTHSDCTDSLDAAHNDYQRGQVFFYIEGSYENEGASLGCLIDQAVWAVVGGGSGQVFGNNPIWLFDPNWEDALDSEGSVAMGHLADLFESRAWWLLKPDLDHDVMLSGGDGTAAARVAGGETLIIYTPSARTLTVDLTELTFLAENGSAWWFDPVDGSTQGLGVFPATGNHDFVAPGRGVLVIDNADVHLGAPGSSPY